ncbi:MAG: ATP-dependent sacrificial sulfur transferase LarE [Actinomycetota bacterium]|nr:ATP-dependent sacrificial sulfur transferase LarE [Actinomycetota bacterium]
MDGILREKLAYLEEILRSFSSAIVSYSGGVDSTLLAVMARWILGDSMVAVIIDSPLLPSREMDRAVRLSGELAFSLRSMRLDEPSQAGIRYNPRNRCYLCKRQRLLSIKEMALEEGFREVLDGLNRDDDVRHRPGGKALEELGVRSPLREAGLAKPEIRAVAADLGLPNWDAPSRPCLATRLPYGMELHPDLLHRVNAAEEMLEGLGVGQVRVRLVARDTARIEVERGEMGILTGKDKRDTLVKKMVELGFRCVLLDLEGYRSGSMDENGGSVRSQIIYAAEG